MLVSEFDRFVAEILVCPEMILPGERLPLDWGVKILPHFDSMDQATATLDAVMAHDNRVAPDPRTAPRSRSGTGP
ncbi:MAG: hypothetical protein ACK4RZ_16705 [Paracoccaceae bacterium]